MSGLDISKSILILTAMSYKIKLLATLSTAVDLERNFNFIVEELPKDTSKFTRSKKSVAVLSDINPSIHFTSIKDFHQMYKYKHHRCRRPVLVKIL